MRTTSLIAVFSTFVIGIAVGCSPSPGTQEPNSDDNNIQGNNGGSTSSSSSGGKKDGGKSSTSSSGGSSSGSSTSSSSGSSSSSSTSSSGGSSGSTSSSSGSSSGGANDQACAAKTTADECAQCCDDAHNGGSKAGDDVYMACICQSPGTCKTQCANSVCANNPPQQGDACDTCLQNDTTCGQKADDACNANADCKAFEACMNTAQCDQKQ